MKNFIISISLILLVCNQGFSQTPGGQIYFTDSSLINNAKVYAYGKEKTLAWSGGLNSPNFSIADLNNDGIGDLVVFEDYVSSRPDFINGVKTFINRGTPSNPKYVYEPRYEYNFPLVKEFIKLIDYNCDNIPDLFTYGIQYFSGYYNGDDELCFGPPRNVMYYEPVLGYVTYLNVAYPAIPAIEDVDNDGDPDIVTFGLTNIALYKNMRVELGAPCDTVFLKLKDNCWGKVQQGVQREHYLHQWCDNSGLKTTHGANSFTLFDNDGDGDYDVLDGNFAYSDLQYLHNGRVEYNYPVDSIVSQDTLWQSNGHKLHMVQFPASFWVDVTQDGLKDILVAPHGADMGENYKCVAYYKNTGTPGNYQYTYQSDTFLVDQMIDMGSASYPVLYDYDKDGKPDLFVGSDGFFTNGTLKSKLAYYKNTSTPGNISFELVNGDFLALNNFEGAAPAIGDLNGDGKDDLVIGRSDGSLSFFNNVAASGSVEPVWQLVQTTLTDASGAGINVGYFAAPFIYDIDKDGKNDLIVGCQYGTLSYYKNIKSGTGSNVMLQKVTDNLGGAKADPQSFSNGFSVPFIGEVDDTGIDYMLLGSETGALYRYDGFQSGNTTTPYFLKDTLYSQLHINARTAPAIADVDGDGKMEMIVGNIKGGLHLFQQLFKVGVENNNMATTHKIELYPNPAKTEIFMHLDHSGNDVAASVTIYSNIGQIVDSRNVSFNNKTLILDVASYAPGIYLCHIKIGQDTYTGKFIKE